MTDGERPAYRAWDAGVGDEDSPLDRSIATTRDVIWPLYRLDPWFDR